VSLDLVAHEERIQSLADILSLLAMVGGMDKAAVQRVLVSLGSALLDVRTPLAIDRDLASRLLVRIAKESGEQAAIDIANDFTFVARAWQPTLRDFLPLDPHRILPYAEIIYAMIIHGGYALEQYGAFEQFGGPDVVLPMPQLTAALKTYPVPRTGLTWELFCFDQPGDQALVASDSQNYYVVKAAASPVRLRISELERGSSEELHREHDIRVDPPLFAAFVAGLLGDLLFWAARLRNHAAPGHEIWQRLITLLMPTPKRSGDSKPPSGAPSGGPSQGSTPPSAA